MLGIFRHVAIELRTLHPLSPRNLFTQRTCTYRNRPA